MGHSRGLDAHLLGWAAEDVSTSVGVPAPLMREDSTLTAPREGIVMRVRGRFRHPGRTGAAAVAGVTVVACLAVGSPAYGSQQPVAGTPHGRATQAPALPGAQPISGNDRV